LELMRRGAGRGGAGRAGEAQDLRRGARQAGAGGLRGPPEAVRWRRQRTASSFADSTLPCVSAMAGRERACSLRRGASWSRSGSCSRPGKTSRRPGSRSSRRPRRSAVRSVSRELRTMPAPPAAAAPRESCRTAQLTRAPRQATELFRSLDEAAFGDEADAMHTDAAERLVPPRPGASPRFTEYLKIVGNCRTITEIY